MRIGQAKRVGSPARGGYIMIQLRVSNSKREHMAVKSEHDVTLLLQDWCGGDRVTFATMELLKGETLREHLSKQGLPVRKATSALRSRLHARIREKD